MTMQQDGGSRPDPGQPQGLSRMLAGFLAAGVALGVGTIAWTRGGAGAATADAMVAYGFDEGTGTTTADASAHAQTGSLTSTTWSPSGRFGGALSFNGSSSRVSSASSLSLGSSFAVTAWVSNPTNAAYETVAAAGTQRDVYLRSGRLSFFDGDADLDLGVNVPTGRWVHVAVTSDGSTLRAYVDGTAAPPVAVSIAPSPPARLQVGAWPNGASYDDTFSGLIDEVRWYGRNLSSGEVATDMSTPVSTGTSAPPTTATPTTTEAPTTTSTPTTTAPSGTGRSLRFFGNGRNGIDRVRIPLTSNRSIDVGGDFTIEWWMKVEGPLVDASCGTYESGWIYGNIVLDRDVFGAGDYGDYGVSVRRRGRDHRVRREPRAQWCDPVQHRGGGGRRLAPHRGDTIFRHRFVGHLHRRTTTRSGDRPDR
jgi:hypothetical protein